MRMLGPKASLRQHRLQLLYTIARLKAHKEPAIQAIGDRLAEKLREIRAFEKQSQELEEAQIMIQAIVDARDTDRDTTIVLLGAFLKGLSPELYAQILHKRPSDIARASHDQETKDLQAVVLRLETLPPDHLASQTYLATLKTEIEAFQKALESKLELEQNFVTFRFQQTQGKLAADEARYHAHADCAKFLPKAAVGELFTSVYTTSAA